MTRVALIVGALLLGFSSYDLWFAIDDEYEANISFIPGVIGGVLLAVGLYRLTRSLEGPNDGGGGARVPVSREEK